MGAFHYKTEETIESEFIFDDTTIDLIDEAFNEAAKDLSRVASSDRSRREKALRDKIEKDYRGKMSEHASNVEAQMHSAMLLKLDTGDVKDQEKIAAIFKKLTSTIAEIKTAPISGDVSKNIDQIYERERNWKLSGLSDRIGPTVTVYLDSGEAIEDKSLRLVASNPRTKGCRVTSFLYILKRGKFEASMQLDDRRWGGKLELTVGVTPKTSEVSQRVFSLLEANARKSALPILAVQWYRMRAGVRFLSAYILFVLLISNTVGFPDFFSSDKFDTKLEITNDLQSRATLFLENSKENESEALQLLIEMQLLNDRFQNPTKVANTPDNKKTVKTEAPKDTSSLPKHWFLKLVLILACLIACFPPRTALSIGVDFHRANYTRKVLKVVFISIPLAILTMFAEPYFQLG